MRNSRRKPPGLGAPNQLPGHAGKTPIYNDAPDSFRILSATMARRQLTGDGKRIFGPFKVHLDCQMSPLAVVSDTLVFYVYQNDPNNVMKIVTNVMLRRFYTRRLQLEGGYPKPAGEGRLEVITDREFELNLRQAEAAQQQIFRIGDPKDPTAWHAVPKSKIILPSGFSR